jgi:hypothetical protein
MYFYEYAVMALNKKNSIIKEWRILNPILEHSWQPEFNSRW